VLVLPDPSWRVLTYGWAFAFAFAGALNLYVAYNYSMDTWVTFKFIGLLLLNVLFMVATFVYLYSKGLLNEANLPDPAKDKKQEQS
jgi:intracellular septation protein